MSGDTTGVMSVWDTLTAPPDGNEEVMKRPVLQFQAHSDCTNGIRYDQSHNSPTVLLDHVEEFCVNLRPCFL